MRLSPSIKGLLIALLLTGLSFAVYFVFLSKKNYHVADNASDQTVYMQLDSQEKKIIGAGESLHLQIPNGKHTIKISDKNGNLIKDTIFTVTKQRGLINLTGSPYYIYTQYYGYNLNKDSLLAALPKTVIDGKSYYGGAKEFKGLYTEDFYFNVDEDLDKVIKNIQKVETRKKIFRKQDFLNHYQETYKF